MTGGGTTRSATAGLVLPASTTGTVSLTVFDVNSFHGWNQYSAADIDVTTNTAAGMAHLRMGQQ